MVPYGWHGWNSLPIMSLQGQQRRREHGLHSLHVLLAYMHAYSASLLCSSVIDRCGWGNSHVFCLKRKQPKQLCDSDPNLFIILRVSPAVVSFLPLIHACYRLLDHSVTWMLQTFFFGATDDTWGFKIIVSLMLIIWILPLKG